MDDSQSLQYALRFNFLYVDVYAFTRMWAYQTTALPYALLRYILAGEGEFVIDGKQMVVREDHVVYIPEGSMLDCKALTDNFKFMSIRFVTTVSLQQNEFLAEHIHIANPQEVRGNQVLEKCQEIYRAATNGGKGKAFRIRGNLELIIAWLAERGEQRPQKSVFLESQEYSIEKVLLRVRKTTIMRDPRIQAVEDYIITHPTEKLDLKLLCRIAEVSEPSLRRLFKQQTGKAPSVYIRELQINIAARELLASGKRVSDIAYALGYDDPNYFARVFKGIIGLSPLEYRKVSRA